jgi:beta-lactam-binding protein with PASTA domain/tRNA A-37 threonylcarbamoyl transferase component Bud32
MDGARVDGRFVSGIPVDPERIFNNRYRIEKRLGNGGMALVYSGTDTLLRRRVAIKVLREQYAADDDFVRRFSYEAQAAAKLSHPNIVSVYDFGSEDHAYFIVMELIDGETLAEQIAAEHLIPEPVAVDYAIQIASGLAYAHRQGLLHRDIKPANILITKDDVVKISDFGIARAVSENTLGVTQPGMVMGSVYYLSPEQAQGLEIDETSDLYSVGVVLFQMLTGTLPFAGDSPVAVALKHVSAPAPAIDCAATGISPALASIVARLLQKNPRDRFASATELASALREARERPAVAQPVGAPTAVGAGNPLRPPPRRSAAPDRRPPEASTPGQAAAAGAPVAAARPALRAIGFVALLVVAVIAGYLLFGRARPVVETITLGDYTNRSVNAAQQDLAGFGLLPKISQTTSETVAANRVIRQSPLAGAKLVRGAEVALVVSSGAPYVAVPSILGYTNADAQHELANAKLRARVVERYGGEPKDQVVAVAPAPGQQLREGALVTLTVSKGPQPAHVPNVVSMNVDDARAVLRKLGLTLNVVDKQVSDTIPQDTIMSQAQAPNSQADRGTAVDVMVSLGPSTSSVPDVGGKVPADALSLLRGAGFAPEITYNVDPTNAGGTVTAQQPAPGSSAKRGSKVAIFIGVPGTVPDVAGMTLDDAKAALEKNGYQSGNLAYTTDCVGAAADDTTPCPGDEGKIVRTEPEANKDVKPGEAITLYVHRAEPPK